MLIFVAGTEDRVTPNEACWPRHTSPDAIRALRALKCLALDSKQTAGNTYRQAATNIHIPGVQGALKKLPQLRLLGVVRY
jgi:hypothetical protein